MHVILSQPSPVEVSEASNLSSRSVFIVARLMPSLSFSWTN